MPAFLILAGVTANAERPISASPPRFVIFDTAFQATSCIGITKCSYPLAPASEGKLCVSEHPKPCRARWTRARGASASRLLWPRAKRRRGPADKCRSDELLRCKCGPIDLRSRAAQGKEVRKIVTIHLPRANFPCVSGPIPSCRSPLTMCLAAGHLTLVLA